MEIEETFRDLFQNPAEITTLPSFIISLAMSAILGAILAKVYIVYGQALSNRRSLARTFLMLAITTTLIITIVKSSLALSLGLVGALSIVRFRAAIKEPEELTYLFLAIGVGLGMGANQPLVTTIAFVLVVAIIIITRFSKSESSQANMFVTVSSTEPASISASQVMKLLSDAGAKSTLKRADENPSLFEASFLVDFKDVSSLEKFKVGVRALSPNAHLSCIDNHGIGA
jgi:Domain of unknown function (DUF4956)